ncbi:hypothetical protein CYMTET_52242 [Cymbomonas tetramitiformis]|uniref:SMODS and SLOG-associating 2TM effector domain-containing protein n=1 Tax=Cymbomonas tetramitiformis TaxID=36881 RepID=A0AAE0BKL2_9CHLO|nr:hypothetical protein CYMTET_52242 [Cymbomonas tetramitiformis]
MLEAKELIIQRERSLNETGQTTIHEFSDIAMLRQVLEKLIHQHQNLGVQSRVEGVRTPQYIYRAMATYVDDFESDAEGKVKRLAEEMVEFYQAFSKARFERSEWIDRSRLKCLAEEFATAESLSVVRERLKTVSVVLQLEGHRKSLLHIEQALQGATIRRVVKSPDGLYNFMEYLYLCDSVTEAQLGGIKSQIQNALLGIMQLMERGGLPLSYHQNTLGMPPWIPAVSNRWLELLLHKRVSAGNISDVKEISRKLLHIAKLDSLPDKNTWESLVVIRDCWNKVDHFSRTATHCKHATKAAFLLVVVLTAVTSIIVVVNLNIGTDSDDYMLSLFITVISIVISVVASLTAYFDPSSRWTQLRGAALAIESEIWKFRTRSCEYATSSKQMDVRAAEHQLRTFAEDVAEQVLRSTSIMQSTFFANIVLPEDCPANPQWYRHGQFVDSRNADGGHPHLKASSTAGTPEMVRPAVHNDLLFDDHQSPLKPSEYVRFRILSQCRFYQLRLPTYHRNRSISQTVIVALALTGSLFSILSILVWTAVVMAFVSALTAWVEFNGVSSKMLRYSSAVHQLSQLLLWWESLTDVDKAHRRNVDHLVGTSEMIFATVSPHVAPLDLVVLRELGENRPFTYVALALRIAKIYRDESPLARLSAPSPPASGGAGRGGGKGGGGGGGGDKPPVGSVHALGGRQKLIPPVGEWKPALEPPPPAGAAPDDAAAMTRSAFPLAKFFPTTGAPWTL